MKANELVEGAIGRLLASRQGEVLMRSLFDSRRPRVMSCRRTTLTFYLHFFSVGLKSRKGQSLSSPASSITCHVTATSKTGTS